MNPDNSKAPEASAKNVEKKPYQPPRLEPLGSFIDLTQGGVGQSVGMGIDG